MDQEESGSNPLTYKPATLKSLPVAACILEKKKITYNLNIPWKMAVNSIDGYCKSISNGQSDKEGSYPTLLYTNIKGIEPQEAVKCTDPIRVIPGRSPKRAQRCLMCECLECVKVCEYLAHYRSSQKVCQGSI